MNFRTTRHDIRTPNGHPHRDMFAEIKADWARRDAGEACQGCGAPIDADGKHLPPSAAPASTAKEDTGDMFAAIKAQQVRDGIR